MFPFALAGSRDDLAASHGDSEGLSDERQIYSRSNAKVEAMQDYQSSDHKLNAEGKFTMYNCMKKSK